jgi:hypothetical protein
MDYKNKQSKKIVKETLITMLMISLIISSFSNLSEKNINFFTEAESSTNSWKDTIKILGPSGTSSTLVIGEMNNASNGKDEYDIPLPPDSPQRPLLVAWFNTNLDLPYDKLLVEYKKPQSNYQVWNISILWQNDPSNKSDANIVMSWDSLKLADSNYNSIQLYENENIVKDMLRSSSYYFNVENNILSDFKIICQNNITKSESNNNQIVILIIFIIFILIILIAIFIIKNKKK